MLPFAFNDREEIEIRSGASKRGSGSRLPDQRTRGAGAVPDVQLLFAPHAASGAHSGAMVSQGRINALIDARPAERRLLPDDC